MSGTGYLPPPWVDANNVIYNPAQSSPGPTNSLVAFLQAHVVTGQCKLTVSSAIQLLLSPCGGNLLRVNGVPLQIPAAGLTLSNSGLSASTLYYIYVNPLLGLEASTTGYIAGSDGTPVKSTDATRALVGMICTNGSSQFVDSLTAGRLCLSYYNRRRKAIQSGGVTYSTSSTSPVQLITSIPFLSWGDENVQLGAQGYMGIGNTSTGPYASLSIYVDGGAIGASCVGNFYNSYTNLPISARVEDAISEGLHSFYAAGLTSAGTVTFNIAIDAMIEG